MHSSQRRWSEVEKFGLKIKSDLRPNMQPFSDPFTLLLLRLRRFLLPRLLPCFFFLFVCLLPLNPSLRRRCVACQPLCDLQNLATVISLTFGALHPTNSLSACHSFTEVLNLVHRFFSSPSQSSTEIFHCLFLIFLKHSFPFSCFLLLFFGHHIALAVSNVMDGRVLICVGKYYTKESEL